MSEAFNEALVIEAFTDFLHATAKPKGSLSIIGDGQLHRYCIEGDNSYSLNGAYRLSLDGCPAGYVQDWKRGIKANWKYNFSPEERRAYGRRQHDPEERAKHETARREAERAKVEELRLQQEKQQAARQMALQEYLASDLFGVFKHRYLHSRFKDFNIENSTAFNSFDVLTGHEPQGYHPVQRMPIAISRGRVQGGLCKTGELLIPMLNIESGDFQSLIHIPTTPNQEGKFSKMNYKGLSIQGAAHWLIPKYAENAGCLCMVEGISTGLAIMILTHERFPVFVCGSCHNIRHVARGLRRKYPRKTVIIFADNDEAGITAAQECLTAGLVDDFKTPPRDGEDFYDYLARRKGK